MTDNTTGGVNYPGIDIDKAIADGLMDKDDQIALVSVHQINWLCQHLALLEAQLKPIVDMFNQFQASPMAGMIPGGMPNGRGPILPPGVKRG